MVAPPLRALSADAAKRLGAIAALEELGSGFTLATHDLEIRGAGELLGEGQSGQIQAIGFTLYNELLARAVAELREGREPDLDDPFSHGPEIETGLAALIPEDYMPDVHMRLVHYKRIANAATKPALDELQVELIDRFGLLPEPARNHMRMAEIKLRAVALGIEKIDAADNGGYLVFGDETRTDPVALVQLVQNPGQTYRLSGAHRLQFRQDLSDFDIRFREIEKLLDTLGAKSVENSEQAS